MEYIFGVPGEDNVDILHAQSFCAKEYRVEDAAELTPLLKQTLADETVRSSTVRSITRKI